MLGRADCPSDEPCSERSQRAHVDPRRGLLNVHTLKHDRIPLFIFTVFLVVGGFVMSHHELWRDDAGCTVIALGIVTAVIQIMPPPDSGMYVGWQFGLSYDALSRIAKALVGAYLPVPTIGLNYWNNPVCLDRQLRPLNLFCSLAVLGYVVFVLAGLRRNPTALLVFGAGTAGLLTFFYAKHFSAARHHGFLFICLVVSAWMAQSRVPTGLASRVASTVHDRWARALSVSLTLLFGIHVAAAEIASVLECRYPFSAAQAVANAGSRKSDKRVGHL